MLFKTKIITKDTWQTRWYQDEDKAGHLRLGVSHYGEKEQALEGFFDWLYADNPAGPARVTVGEELETGDIIGFLWHVPLQVRFYGRTDIGYLGCNGLVHPNYRRQGIYVTFHDLVFQDITDGLFVYGFPKPIAVFPLKKVGIFQVSRIPLLVRPLDIDYLTQVRAFNPFIRFAVNKGWRIAGATIWRPQQILKGKTGIQISAETCFDETFDDFWERVKDKYNIIIERKRAFLNWRFCNLSFRSYQILAARKMGRLLGYAVLRKLDIEGVRTGLIMDLLVEPSEQGLNAGRQLIQEATHRFKEDKVALAGCLMLPHTQEYKLLRQAGYVDCPEQFAPQTFRLTAISLSPDVSNGELAKVDNWFMTMANHDAV